MALVVAYGVSYFLTHLGLGMIPSGDGSARGPAVLSRAGLNLCAMQHATLIGEGRIPGGPAGPQKVSAYIVLPITIWVVIPMFALLVGGYVGAARRSGAGSFGAIAPAVFGGILYAGALAALSQFFSAYVEGSPLPAIEGSSLSPPYIPFRATVASTLVFAGLLGVVFTYLGALVTRTGRPTYGAGRWWACAKSTVVCALAVQILIAAGAGAWYASGYAQPEAGAVRGKRFSEMLPTMSAVGYALIQGATLRAGIETRMPGSDTTYRPLDESINLYRGVSRQDDEREYHRPIPKAAYLLLIVPAFAVFLAGRLGVRWGARGGSLPTAARIVVIHTAYVLVLMLLSSVGWGEHHTNYAAFIAPSYDILMLISAAVVFVLAFAGAAMAGRGRAASGAF
ncbi:MAG: hypothetical protein A2Z18_07790 [Armatimonadetes bacterium RBG_16_58_9]|nr:MAG: hypothetical protein A2Z18_07790 [Armatimonadetes bacterium RBG_16_58_9]